jgi:hypothetical protein
MIWRWSESEERYRTAAEFTYDWEYWLGDDKRFIYSTGAPAVGGSTAKSAQVNGSH